MAEKPVAEKSGLFSNILAVAGLVILIGMLFWGFFHLGTLSGSWFSSFASMLSPSSKSIRVTVPAKEIPSGEEFPVSWKYTPRSAGTYAFLYQCRGGFQFKTTAASGGQNAIPCGAGYTMPSQDNTFSVIPILAGTSSLDVSISIVFIPSASAATGTPASQAQGNASVTVINSEDIFPITAAAAPTAPAEKTPEPEPEVIEAPVVQISGSPDLSVQILSTGVIDPISGNIVARAPMSPDDTVAVRFLISNDGKAQTGIWYFTARLPVSPEYPYTSPAQASLAPGASIENMLRFTYAIPEGVFTATADPYNQVGESNENNNVASTTI